MNSSPSSEISFETHYRKLARRTTLILFIAQCFGSAGFLAVATVTSIVGRNLTGSNSLATAPDAIFQLSASIAALIWGYAMDRLGRRGGLTLGIGIGIFGAGLIALAVVNKSLTLLFLGLAGMGAARSALQLARFAAAEVYPANERARAISNVVIGGTVATFIWAGISRYVDSWMITLGLDYLIGPYLMTCIFFLLASTIVFTLLRPDPRDIGKELSEFEKINRIDLAPRDTSRPVLEIFRQPAVWVSTIAMVTGQVVMIMVMLVTPLYMSSHEHMLSHISLVVSSHVFGMYAFSILSGRLADRFGRSLVIILGAGILCAACLIAPLSPEALPLGFSLFLLGLGWNFCYIGGSSLLADQLSPEERSRTQGFNDLLIGLISALASLGSGFIYGTGGYGVLAVIGTILSICLIGLMLWWQTSRPPIGVKFPNLSTRK